MRGAERGVASKGHLERRREDAHARGGARRDAGSRNVVSDRLNCRAMACIAPSSSPRPSSKTHSGLPENGLPPTVNTLRMRKARVDAMMPTGYHVCCRRPPPCPFACPPLALAALAATFAAGVAASQLWVREARAQTTPFAATIYVPSDGLAFRTFDGRVVARLSHDAHGGVFELYDEREQPVTRVRADSFTHLPAGPTERASRRPNGDPDLGF